MPTLCDTCRIRPCDWLSAMCPMSDGELAKMLVGLPDEKAARLRAQKRDHNRRIREARRAEVPALTKAVKRMLNEYGAFGKHTDLVKLIREICTT